MDRGGQQVAVQGVEAQVVSVIRVLRPNLVQHNDKLDRILQSHRQAAALGHHNVNTGGGTRWLEVGMHQY